MTTHISGFASGLDVDSLVKQMMQAKKVPVDKMKQQQQTLVWKRDQYRSMNTMLSQLKDAANALRFSSTLAAKKVTAGSSAVSVSGNPNAVIGTQTLTVQQLATGGAMVSSSTVSSTASMAASATTLSVNGTNITINDGATVSDVVKAINAQSGTTGVSASYDTTTQRMYLNTSKTGAVAQINLSVTDADTGGDGNLLSNLGLAATGVTTATAAGQDAIVNFNGVSNIHQSSNSFTLNNINFQLLQPPAKDASGNNVPYDVTITVTADVDKAVDAVKNFVNTYNDIISKVYDKTHEQRYRDFPPLTDDQKASMKDTDIANWNDKAQSGLLQNDMTLNSALNQFRSVLGATMTGVPAGQYNSLDQVGITTAKPGNSTSYMEHGKLYLDEAKLRETLMSNPDQVMSLFGKANTVSTVTKPDGSTSVKPNLDGGFASNLYTVLNAKMKEITGLAGSTTSQADTSTLGLQISSWSTKITDANNKLSTYEQQYYNQFSKLEAAMNKANSQSSMFSSMMSSN
ncbi:flagellar filament capping protein FliD [Tumebacillus flagellatus]|uniref:Flagellar hook-associated protein 2 n=1 Tax=Tumebacillus flagellatus TaxID=1157490 RepID=A0A074LVL3_9BACL|nr:flagellar filament capping protein FliD [Tumebacillus flagellatus]KEO84073.1 hypothetical protein EL26_06310 [Tumebacillus flagellatus]